MAKYSTFSFARSQRMLSKSSRHSLPFRGAVLVSLQGNCAVSFFYWQQSLLRPIFYSNIVNSLKAGTSIKRTPRLDGQLLEIPANTNRKCCMFVFYKTDYSLRRTVSTIFVFQTQKTLLRSGCYNSTACSKTITSCN